MDRVHEFIEYVHRSPSAFHAVEALVEMLDKNGFIRLQENTAWQIVSGGKYYVTRNRSALIALTIPQQGFAHFQIVASHSDSPTFKLKPNAEEAVCGKYVRLNTEKYGGMLMASWFDRPLSIAGRVLVADGNGISTKLVDVGHDLVLIPNMPIHFNREVNEGYKYNPQVDMLPLYGDVRARNQLLSDIATSCDVNPESIVGSDLFLYSRTPGSVWGANNEFFSCGRIDDLECAYTSAQAFLSVKDAEHINVLAVLDNEEVGSGSKQGADSDMMESVLFRVAEALGATPSEYRAAVAASFMVSADNAHAVHPNHADKYDADNRCFMNEGIVVKHNANQKYTTDGVASAIFTQICAKVNVPTQHFSNRSDIVGGSTLGNIANAHLSMNTVDVGLPQLAMHSCCETAGVLDLDFMVDGLAAFYRTEIQMCADGEFVLK